MDIVAVLLTLRSCEHTCDAPLVLDVHGDVDGFAVRCVSTVYADRSRVIIDVAHRWYPVRPESPPPRSASPR